MSSVSSSSLSTALVGPAFASSSSAWTCWSSSSYNFEVGIAILASGTSLVSIDSSAFLGYSLPMSKAGAQYLLSSFFFSPIPPIICTALGPTSNFYILLHIQHYSASCSLSTPVFSSPDANRLWPYVDQSLSFKFSFNFISSDIYSIKFVVVIRSIIFSVFLQNVCAAQFAKIAEISVWKEAWISEISFSHCGRSRVTSGSVM